MIRVLSAIAMLAFLFASRISASDIHLIHLALVCDAVCEEEQPLHYEFDLTDIVGQRFNEDSEWVLFGKCLSTPGQIMDASLERLIVDRNKLHLKDLENPILSSECQLLQSIGSDSGAREPWRTMR